MVHVSQLTCQPSDMLYGPRRWPTPNWPQHRSWRPCQQLHMHLWSMCTVPISKQQSGEQHFNSLWVVIRWGITGSWCHPSPPDVSLAPLDVLQLIKRGCASGNPCSTARCGCYAAHLSCSMFCSCNHGEHHCCNKSNTTGDEKEDDDELVDDLEWNTFVNGDDCDMNNNYVICFGEG